MAVILTLFLFFRNKKRRRNNLEIKDGVYYKTILFLIAFLTYLLFALLLFPVFSQISYLLIYIASFGVIFLGLVYINKNYYFVNVKKLTIIVFGMVLIIFIGLFFYKLLSDLRAKNDIEVGPPLSGGCDEFQLF